MNLQCETLISLLGEGGKLAILRCKTNKENIYVYNHSEYGWEVTDDIDESTRYNTFIEAFAQIDSRYPWHWFSPEVIHSEYHDLLRAALIDILNRRHEIDWQLPSLRGYEELLGIRLEIHSVGYWSYQLSGSPISKVNANQMITSIKDWHEKLLKAWENQTLSSIVPMIYPNPEPNSLLFVGINPSYNAKDIRSVLKDTEFSHSLSSDQEVDEFFRFKPGSINQDLPALQKIQRLHHHHLRYFDRHRQTAKLLNMAWEQADLFQLRKSVQNEFTELVSQGFLIKRASELSA